TRLSGKDRYETAIQVNYERQRVVSGGEAYGGDYSSYFLASGSKFPDALVAAPLIGQMKGQFYDDNDPIGSNPAMYLALYNPDYFDYGWYIIGGESAIPHHHDYSVIGSGGIRIAGKNRYGTAVKIANMYPKETGKKIDTVVLASGLNYPDALASSPYVSSRNAVLLLTNPNYLSIETRDYILENNIKNIVIVGGTSAVSENVVAIIKGLK
ncbi:MAG: cell wall-binding repeat-containing protein, partial [Neofamilia sp.]